MRVLARLVIPGMVIAATACGGGLAPASVTSLTAAQAAVRAADEVGAKDVPRAALHLQFAQEQIESAEVLLEEGEDELAAWKLSRAEADAEVALALARQVEAEAAASEAEARLNAARRAAQEAP